MRKRISPTIMERALEAVPEFKHVLRKLDEQVTLRGLSWVLRMRSAMPSEESVIVLMAKTAMDKTAYRRELPAIDWDKKLFP